MGGDEAMASAPLLSAFNTLLPVAPPERVATVLRQALTALLAEE